MTKAKVVAVVIVAALAGAVSAWRIFQRIAGEDEFEVS